MIHVPVSLGNCLAKQIHYLIAEDLTRASRYSGSNFLSRAASETRRLSTAAAWTSILVQGEWQAFVR